MSADENLHPVQFHRDPADRDRDKAAEYDAKGADEAESFGYDEYGYSDAQWNRHKHSDKPEVF